MAHPQYKAAMKAAPDFTRDALIAVENLRFTLEQQ
jgi:hypothetical protein